MSSTVSCYQKILLVVALSTSPSVLAQDPPVRGGANCDGAMDLLDSHTIGETHSKGKIQLRDCREELDVDVGGTPTLKVEVAPVKFLMVGVSPRPAGHGIPGLRSVTNHGTSGPNLGFVPASFLEMSPH